MAVTIDTRGVQGLHADAPATARIAERARAFATARRHSRRVRLLRVAMPLAAGGIALAYTLALGVSWQLNAGRLKVAGIELSANDLAMKEPSYFGVTNDGGRYQIRARRAVVGLNQNAPIKLIDISGDLFQASNVTTKLKAKHGEFDNAKGELELYDGIEIDASNGLMARLSRATIYSKESKVVSKHPVSANTPTGAVQAAAMTMNTKTRLMQFRGAVAVRLVPSQKGAIGAGRDARQPLDIYAEELDVDDAQKTAHFRGKVVAMQGDTMLNTPYLFVKYEGKGATALGSAAQQPASEQGTRVTFLWARNGVEITAGNDRHVTSDSADFDLTADTALFAGNVVVKQDKNVLQGGRLLVERKTGRSRLEAPAEGNQPAGRIAATFYQSDAGAEARQPTPKSTAAEAAQQAMLGSFKVNPNEPMEVEANTLEVHDGSKKAIFSGNVAAQQGDFVIRTVELTAFYTGRTGFGLTEAAGDAGAKGKGQDKGQIVRIEARQKVLITSKDDQSATADWANFDVKANTALLGGGVFVMRGKNTAEGPRLKIDLTTGMYRFEEETGPAPAAKQPSVKQAPVASPATSSSPPATSSSPPTATTGPATPTGPATGTCPPGRQCGLFYPEDAKDKAKNLLKKGPAVDAR